MPNSTIADAILDRIVHTAIRIELKGESMVRQDKCVRTSECESHPRKD
jgi:hypothetical protein